MKGDKARATAASTRAANVHDRGSLTCHIDRPAINEVRCRYCGRHWIVQPKNGVSSVGFIVSAATNHGFTCQSASALERRSMARLAEKAWARTRPSNKIENNPRHPGYGGVDYREEL